MLDEYSPPAMAELLLKPFQVLSRVLLVGGTVTKDVSNVVIRRIWCLGVDGTAGLSFPLRRFRYQR